MGGLSDSINPYVKLDNDNETVAKLFVIKNLLLFIF